jgi:pyruvate/2-oxoglutarate dehydrogenase complex dihydrolipoamide acyltransferase (E2) component
VALEFALPDVGEGIAAGELVAWHVAEGDDVREDQPLADVQTDKAIVTIPCPTTGRVLELRASEGDTVPVGAVLAVFEHGEELAETGGAAAAPASGLRRPLASPAVRKRARDRGVDLAGLTGSGPGGRIVREDVEAAVARSDSEPPGADDQVVPLRGIRRAIARTLTHAWQTVPHVTDYREVDATGLRRAHLALRARAERAGDERLAAAMTLTPLLVKIAVRALRRHPYVNASIDLERDEITLHGECHVGVATATPDGLLVPVVHDAAGKSLTEVALEIAALTAAARERRLTAAQQSGGTITVNNYGGLGIWLGTPIVRPPEVANLGVGRVQERPVAVDGQVVVKPILPLAVSGDHRLLDGHTLGAFVSEVVELMEDPVLLLPDAP